MSFEIVKFEPRVERLEVDEIYGVGLKVFKVNTVTERSSVLRYPRNFEGYAAWFHDVFILESWRSPEQLRDLAMQRCHWDQIKHSESYFYRVPLMVFPDDATVVGVMLNIDIGCSDFVFVRSSAWVGQETKKPFGFEELKWSRASFPNPYFKPAQTVDSSALRLEYQRIKDEFERPERLK